VPLEVLSTPTAAALSGCAPPSPPPRTVIRWPRSGSWCQQPCRRDRGVLAPPTRGRARLGVAAVTFLTASGWPVLGAVAVRRGAVGVDAGHRRRPAPGAARPGHLRAGGRTPAAETPGGHSHGAVRRQRGRAFAVAGPAARGVVGLYRQTHDRLAGAWYHESDLTGPAIAALATAEGRALATAGASSSSHRSAPAPGSAAPWPRRAHHGHRRTDREHRCRRGLRRSWPPRRAPPMIGARPRSAQAHPSSAPRTPTTGAGGGAPSSGGTGRHRPRAHRRAVRQRSPAGWCTAPGRRRPRNGASIGPGRQRRGPHPARPAGPARPTSAGRTFGVLAAPPPRHPHPSPRGSASPTRPAWSPAEPSGTGCWTAWPASTTSGRPVAESYDQAMAERAAGDDVPPRMTWPATWPATRWRRQGEAEPASPSGVRERRLADQAHELRRLALAIVGGRRRPVAAPWSSGWPGCAPWRATWSAGGPGISDWPPTRCVRRLHRGGARPAGGPRCVDHHPRWRCSAHPGLELDADLGRVGRLGEGAGQSAVVTRSASTSAWWWCWAWPRHAARRSMTTRCCPTSAHRAGDQLRCAQERRREHRRLLAHKRGTGTCCACLGATCGPAATGAVTLAARRGRRPGRSGGVRCCWRPACGLGWSVLRAVATPPSGHRPGVPAAGRRQRARPPGRPGRGSSALAAVRRSPFDGNLAGVGSPPRRQVVSSTRLESWATCLRLLRPAPAAVEPVEDPGISCNVGPGRGSLVHGCWNAS
jgi:hypothetical protein